MKHSQAKLISHLVENLLSCLGIIYSIFDYIQCLLVAEDIAATFRELSFSYSITDYDSALFQLTLSAIVLLYVLVNLIQAWIQVNNAKYV